jgi:hypothetical protein
MCELVLQWLLSMPIYNHRYHNQHHQHNKHHDIVLLGFCLLNDARWLVRGLYSVVLYSVPTVLIHHYTWFEHQWYFRIRH